MKWGDLDWKMQRTGLLEGKRAAAGVWRVIRTLELWAQTSQTLCPALLAADSRDVKSDITGNVWRGSQLGGWAMNMSLNVCVCVCLPVCAVHAGVKSGLFLWVQKMSQRALQLETATDRDPHRKKDLAYKGGKKQKRRTLGKNKERHKPGKRLT